MSVMSTIMKPIYYVAKPNKKMLINAIPQDMQKFFCTFAGLKKEGKIVASTATKAQLGDASLYIEKLLNSNFAEASLETENIFKHLGSVDRITARPKGALSICNKLERCIQGTAGQRFNSIDDAIGVIEDGIGTRVITKNLKKLSRPEIDKMVSELQINGKALTEREKKLLYKYIDEKHINPADKDEAFRLFEQFAQPLIEKRSAEVVDTLTLGILQQRLNDGSVTLEMLERDSIFNDNIINALKKGGIKPINVTEINNYRGKYGLPEFSNDQINQLVIAWGFKNPNAKDLKIIADPRALDFMKYPQETLDMLAKKSVKASGYRTAQFNVKYANGALGETQFRGNYTNTIGEYEHIAYDIRQNKDTLGPLFDEYKTAIKSLTPEQYTQYNEYLEKCYNYYNRLELGLPAKPPQLPKGFNKILSEPNLKSLHDKNKLIEKELERDFIPHIEYAA